MLNDWNKKNSAVKNDICHFVKETYFDEKLRKINNKVTSSKTKHVDSKKDLNDHITSYIKLINDLSGKFKLISTRGFTKDLINWYSILNGVKYFVEDVSQNYLYLNQSLSVFKRLLVLIKFLHANLKDCQRRVSELQLYQTTVLLQNLLLFITEE